MLFTPWKCPECGEPLCGTYETVPALAYVEVGENGEAEYTGETKVYWDGQTTDVDSDGKVTVACRSGHSWLATIDEDETESSAEQPAKTSSVDLMATMEKALRHIFVLVQQGADEDDCEAIESHCRAALAEAWGVAPDKVWTPDLAEFDAAESKGPSRPSTPETPPTTTAEE